jgi:hypothetical protein
MSLEAAETVAHFLKRDVFDLFLLLNVNKIRPGVPIQSLSCLKTA